MALLVGLSGIPDDAVLISSFVRLLAAHACSLLPLRVAFRQARMAVCSTVLREIWPQKEPLAGHSIAA